jgi:hypothetical protein
MQATLVHRGPGLTRSLTAGVWLGLTFFTPSLASAHFLWLTAERDKPAIHAFLSETPTPQGPEFLKHIERATISAGDKILSWTRDEDTFRMTLPEQSPATVDGFCDLGVKTRNGVSFNLIYTARVQFGISAEGATARPDYLRMKVIARPGRSPIILVQFRGRPAPGALVKLFPDEGEPVELNADAEGRVDHALIAKERTAYLGKWSEKTPGNLDGKPYDEVRYYATLTVAPVDARKPAEPAGSSSRAPFAVLPEAVNSFGGAVLGDWLYVYSGHTGETHRYDETTTTKHFRRLNLNDRACWEELPGGPALQGVVLLSHHDSLYRIGGMAAQNPPGQPNDLASVADFARYDPQAKSWATLPPMPAPRSTHDAVVVNSKIYVVGGWCLPGGGSENGKFLDTALVFDLARRGAQWESLPTPPFRRRALAAAAIKGKVYVIGGLTENGKVVTTVDLYDPLTHLWSRGPDLPGGKLQGFGPSAFGVRERLFVSGSDGLVHRLNESGDGWEIAGTLTIPRLTHRLLPGIANDLLAVGGTHARSPVALIESIPLDSASRGPR